MTPETIDQLNRLNQAFYDQVAADFDDSRQYAWTGWQQLLPLIEQKVVDGNLYVLDLAAGNHRFLKFLQEHFPEVNITYLAVDNNDFLANQQPVEQHLKLDIVTALQNETFLTQVDQFSRGLAFDLVVSFGFLHHVPSFELRQRFIHNCLELIHPDGASVITAWQFAEDEQQQKKSVDPTLAGINPEVLETNDYILSWKRGSTAYRYCHHVDYQEVVNLTPPATKLTTFAADGKSDQLNTYLVFQKLEE